MSDFLKGKMVDLDREKIMEVAKALFYGYVFLAGIGLLTDHSYTGTLFGLAVLSSLTLTSMAISEGIRDDWQRFLDLIAILTLMLAVLFGSYISLALATGLII